MMDVNRRSVDRAMAICAIGITCLPFSSGVWTAVSQYLGIGHSLQTERRARLAALFLNGLTPENSNVYAVVGRIPPASIIKDQSQFPLGHVKKPADDDTAIAAIVSLQDYAKDARLFPEEVVSVTETYLGGIISAGSPHTNFIANRIFLQEGMALFDFLTIRGLVNLKYNFPSNIKLKGYQRELNGVHFRAFDRIIYNREGEAFKSIIEGNSIKRTYLLVSRVPHPRDRASDVLLICGSTGTATESFKVMINNISLNEISRIEERLAGTRHFQILFAVEDIVYDKHHRRDIANSVRIYHDNGEAAITSLSVI